MTDRLRSGWGRAAHLASLEGFQGLRDLLVLCEAVTLCLKTRLGFAVLIEYILIFLSVDPR